MSVTQVSCGERLSIDRVEQLLSEFEQAVSQGDDIELQAEHVVYCDTAGLQLVISLKDALSKTNHNVSWNKPPEVLKATADYLGLAEKLQLSPDLDSSDSSKPNSVE